VLRKCRARWEEERFRLLWLALGHELESMGSAGDVDWRGGPIVPVARNLWVDHPHISGMTYDDSERIRQQRFIIVTCMDAQKIPTPIENMDLLPFPDWIIGVLRRQGFNQPTAFQVQAWPAAMKGHNIIGISKSGSGKTMSYVVPMLMHTQGQEELNQGEGPIGLVILPQRELCTKLASDIDKFLVHAPLKAVALCGVEGEDVGVGQLLGKVDILVATPARLISLLIAGRINLKRATFVVVDEADYLFNGIFSDLMQMVLSSMRPDRQVLLFASNLDATLQGVAERVCKVHPIQIECDA
jgi:ATP-dependent RNA helicase DDX5/DBP2